MGKKAALHNLGCKVNAYETEAMRQLLEEAGYEIVPFAPGADVYVINTCTVTNIADRKSRQMLHRARKMNPDAIVVAAGCYAQTGISGQEDGLSVDIVLGNNCKKNLVEALRSYEEAHARKAECAPGQTDDSNVSGRQGNLPPVGGSDSATGEEGSGQGASGSTTVSARVSNVTEEGFGQDICSSTTVSVQMPNVTEEESGRDSRGSGAEEDTTVWNEKIDISRTKEFEPLSLAKTQEHTRTYLKVQDGCNQFCSYCIIPYARGRVRSRALDEVIQEVRTLAGNGCREIVLTGIHLSSYGCDQDRTLLDLIQAVHETEGIRRIRLGSLEPGIITEEFAEAVAALPKFCPHFHLSLQSGCDATLRRMNRHYTAREYAEKCDLLRRVFRDPALTTDVIAGFPGETQEEFEETVAFLKDIRLYETHIFKYSRRQGTRAATMSDQVPEQVKAERSDRLIALGEANRRAFEALYSGREVDVLFEEKCTIAGREYYIGYTREYIRAAIPADRDYENVLCSGTLGREIEPHRFLLTDGAVIG